MIHSSLDVLPRTNPVWQILIVLCLAFVLNFAIGCSSTSDPGSRVRISLPAGWEEDLEFGKAIMEEDLGELGTIVFMGGKPMAGGFDPNIFVLKARVRGGTDLKELVDSEVTDIEETSIKMDSRKTSSLAGFHTEVVMFDVTEAANLGYLTGSRLEQTYLIKGTEYYMIQCTSLGASSRDFDICRDTVKTLEFYK